MNLEILQLISNVVILPMVYALWAINGRLSRIEGHLDAIDSTNK